MFFVEKIGYLALAYWGCRLYREVYRRIYKVFVTPNSTTDLQNMGKWCLIAGCTQGIGKAYVEALAKRKLSIILLDTSLEKLKKIAKDMQTTYNIQIKIIELDITKDNINYENIKDEILGLEIGILINNLSVAPSYPDYFLELYNKEKVYRDIICCNILLFTNICQLLLPQMVERRRGIIINVASTFAMIPSPLMTVFAASKAYVLKFSKDIAVEYEKDGIIVQCLCPGSVASVPDSVSEGWITPSPKKYVESAIMTIGKDKITTGFFPHTVLMALLKLVYRLSPDTIDEWMITVMQRNRRRALRRYITE